MKDIFTSRRAQIDTLRLQAERDIRVEIARGVRNIQHVRDVYVTGITIVEDDTVPGGWGVHIHFEDRR